MKHYFTLVLVGSALVLAFGCQQSVDAPIVKKPRPVEVQMLRKRRPPNASLVSASVASWKTEDIGFEVGGRVEWVAEPNTDIEGRVVDEDGSLIIEGTPIARVESERYRLQVDSAEAQVARAEQNIKVANVELRSTIPSQLRAAEAEKQLAQTERERSQRLFDQNAGAKADVDRDEANLQNAISRIEQLQASRKAKEAELQSLSSQLLQAKQSLRDAQRSLEDCTLYSSFRGQIATVHVVPGSVVTAGQAVATVQMMDPIKMEVEVSADESRRLRSRQRFPALVTQADGNITSEEAYLYLIDSVADSQTRTFTLTLLLMNRKNQTALPVLEGQKIAIADQMWRLDFSFLPGTEQGMTYVAQDAIHEDEFGPYLWKAENVEQNEPMPKDNLLKVSKLRVDLGSAKIPFLGNWLFQQVVIRDDLFDPNVNLVVGKLNVEDGDPNSWDGDTILINRNAQWMVRPGDLVKVDLSDENGRPGFYVPMDAIAFDAGKTWMFLIEEGWGAPSTETDAGPNSIVRRVEVKVVEETDSQTTSSLRRVEPVTDEKAFDGKRYVTRGAHYLRDGEPVRVAAVADEASNAKVFP